MASRMASSPVAHQRSYSTMLSPAVVTSPCAVVPIDFFEVLEGVAFGGCPQSLTDDVVEIDKATLAKHLIELCLHGGIAHRKALESRGLVVRVVIDVRVRVTLNMLAEEAHEGFKRGLLFLMRVRPERREMNRGASFSGRPPDAKEIFKALVVERIAFDIEVEVALAGWRKQVDPWPGPGQEVDCMLVGVPGRELEVRLGGKARERRAANAVDLDARRQSREAVQGAGAGFFELEELGRAETGDKDGAVGCAPFVFTTSLVVTLAAGGAGHGACGSVCIGNKGLELRHEAPEDVARLPKIEGLGRSARYMNDAASHGNASQVLKGWRKRRAQHVIGLGLARELGIFWLESRPAALPLLRRRKSG